MQSNFVLPTIGVSSYKTRNSLSRSRSDSNRLSGSNNNNNTLFDDRMASSVKTASSTSNDGKNQPASLPQVVELNVGGHYYTTAMSTLLYEPDSLLSSMFTGNIRVAKDSRGRYFIDRDGALFRYILDYLRNDGLTLPTNFEETDRLLGEAEYFRLKTLCQILKKPRGAKGTTKHQPSGFITLCVRGTYAFGRDGIADIKFRKLQRILVCGNVGVTRDVFQETMNETRDPDRETIGYSSRFYLKHPHLELAFDRLNDSNFKLVTSAAGGAGYDPESEETKWNHFTNYVFFRE